jgi:hypothetical protein
MQRIFEGAKEPTPNPCKLRNHFSACVRKIRVIYGYRVECNTEDH